MKINRMFENISVSDYVIEFDLQKAFFLRDCLYEEIYYELNEDNVIIYKKLDNGISEEITLDELIFYIHTEVVEHVREFRRSVSVVNPKTHFYHLFKDIDNIKKAVENMKIMPSISRNKFLRFFQINILDFQSPSLPPSLPTYIILDRYHF